MLQTKKFIKRSAMDRILPLNRRILNLGPKYPDKEQRMKQNRRQGWEDRVEWQRSNPVEPHSQLFNF